MLCTARRADLHAVLCVCAILLFPVAAAAPLAQNRNATPHVAEDTVRPRHR